MRKKLAVLLAAAAMMLAMAATPALAIPGTGKDERGQHKGYGLAPFHENNTHGDNANEACEVHGHCYGTFNN